MSKGFVFGGKDGAEGAGVDCCTANAGKNEVYKVLCELECARLVEMNLPAGQGDEPHDHPIHHMYVIQGGKLKEELSGNEMDLPDHQAIIMPAGNHKIRNIGETDVKIVFVEPYANGTQNELKCDLILPQTVAPTMYKTLAEDETWSVYTMEMEPGCEDPPHSHLDHFVYVLEGDGVTIYPGEQKSEMKKEVPFAFGAAFPVPAGPHCVQNTGTTKCKALVFEVKPEVKPEAKVEAKPEVASEMKPEAEPEAKPEAKVETKPAGEPEVKPEVAQKAEPEVKPVKKKKSGICTLL